MAQVCMTKLIFLYSGKLQWPRGYQDSVQKFWKFFLTFLGLGTNVVKVSSVNPELLFQLDTLVLTYDAIWGKNGKNSFLKFWKIYTIIT